MSRKSNTPDGEPETAERAPVDYRAGYVLSQVDAVLDRMAVEIFRRMEETAGKGPIGALTAVTAWYERLAIEQLRDRLKKELRAQGVVQRH